jgi:hypothetical protein
VCVCVLDHRLRGGHNGGCGDQVSQQRHALALLFKTVLHADVEQGRDFREFLIRE